MTNGEMAYQSLVQALAVLGKANSDMVLSMLESQHVIRNGQVDARLLEQALTSIFGDGTQVLMARWNA
jgi:hypothetical protein